MPGSSKRVCSVADVSLGDALQNSSRVGAEQRQHCTGGRYIDYLSVHPRGYIATYPVVVVRGETGAGYYVVAVVSGAHTGEIALYTSSII